MVVVTLLVAVGGVCVEFESGTTRREMKKTRKKKRG
jgi:hypothetical protein